MFNVCVFLATWASMSAVWEAHSTAPRALVMPQMHSMVMSA
jgi:hypothetical protein